ncbi:MAG TPA: DUF6689 family protein [Thermoanaerobaculia bacterium]|jgi:hypothetical protein|nr:DUF6689 family protein [Thermoanaerobaculia bacterium]
MSKILICILLCLTAALPAAGQGIANSSVSGNAINLTVSLPGGLGGDVTLSFEDVAGLSLANLGISAQVVNPSDPTLLARLQGATVPSGLPVLLRIEPPAAGGLAFHGIATLEVHTHNLEYVTGCPLRIFSAPLGGPFKDITVSMGAGSYRARGSTGGFSEFLIVSDPRPVNQVITAKLDRLDQMLDDYAALTPGSLYADLEERLEDIRADYARGATAEAIQGVDGFLAAVQQHAGTDIPNLWRSARDAQNVAGYLRAGAMTLRFSLVLKNGPGL